VIDVKKNKLVPLLYSDLASATLVTFAKQGSRIELVTRNRKKHSFWFTSEMPSQDERLPLLQTAMTTLIDHAGQAPPLLCSDDPAEYASELAAFQRDTATWRALPVKPPLTDEAYKDRLLAEDAMKSRNMTVALKFYEDGVAADPAWAQGWYNAAVVYAEMRDEFDAATCMRHYVALMPDAPDVRTAKDNIILWDTKAAAKMPAATEAAPAASGQKRSF
jgi:hypothetical protein